METVVRLSVLAFAALAWIAVGPPASAQTYDPAYPVCMQIYGPVGYFDCRYATTMPGACGRSTRELHRQPLLRAR